MTTSQPPGALWPADVIHVNEDGWVLINRGSQHGVSVGMHLLVVGAGIRDLHDLFAPDSTPDSTTDTQPPALRIRRTYELLEVVYTEESSAIAIATRTPTARRPTVYRGPEGELLVWVPLPEGYSWPPANGATSAGQSETQPWANPSDDGQAAGDEVEGTDAINGASGDADAPPERAPQDDEPWEEALPLNSVSVGDIVLPAVPAGPYMPSASTTPHSVASHDPAATHESASPFEMGRNYDWMKKPGE